MNLINLGYRIYQTIRTVIFLYVNVCKVVGLVTNIVDSDQTPRSAASILGLYRLVRPVCPNM